MSMGSKEGNPARSISRSVTSIDKFYGDTPQKPENVRPLILFGNP